MERGEGGLCERMNPEDSLQIWCYNYLTYNYADLVFYHIPNEAKRELKVVNNKVVCPAASRLKSMGMVDGASDFVIDSGSNVVYVEFKAPGKYQTPKQKIFQSRVEAIGRKYYVCREREHFMEICEKEFGPRRDPNIVQLERILNSK